METVRFHWEPRASSRLACQAQPSEPQRLESYPLLTAAATSLNYPGRLE